MTVKEPSSTEYTEAEKQWVEEWSYKIMQCNTPEYLKRITAELSKESKKRLWKLLGKGHPSRIHAVKLMKQQKVQFR